MGRQHSRGHGESGAGFLSRFARARSGAVAIWFAVMALPLAVLSFALIDINRASVEKRYLQDALDAAVLLVARSTATTNEQAQTLGSAALAAQLAGMSDATLVSSSFKIEGSTVKGAATSGLSPFVSNLWLGGDMGVGAVSEATRAATNLEVAMVLDVTGSMKGQKLTDLKAAANSLIDIVVQDVQSPYYSKVALAPFSVAVNAGGYAEGARGAVVGTKSITDASWTTGSSKSITNITKGNNTSVTSSGHGLQNGDRVYISDVSGMTQVNNKVYTVSNRSTNSFRLSGIKSSSWSSYKSGGTIRKCQVSDCGVVITANSHGYDNGDLVYFLGVKGMTELNGEVFTVANATTNTFSLEGTAGAGDFSAYTSGGTAYCLKEGCRYYRFTDRYGDTRIHEITTCVSERVGDDAYTNAAPSTSPVGRVYMDNLAGCPSATIVPLSTSKADLKASINAYVADSSTAGQIGAAWGWYLVDPNFAYLWPSASQPAAYTKPDLLKVVIMMTDGEFNTEYCKGVLAKDSQGSSYSERIDCNATNGDGTAQALAQCTAMKKAGVVVYSVGFELGNNNTAKNFIEKCATSSDNVYLPSGGGALKDAFASIGKDIMKLRLSK
jgi:Flp pilus assembly protein TadG